MMNSKTLRLVLLVSCCHGLVHVYEHSFASVEQLVGDEFGVGTETTGIVAACFGFPFGLFALAAGWLADRFGTKRLLLIYLVGCSVAGAVAWRSPTLATLTMAMFTMGTFASIYHPAGVGLISLHTVAENRPMALAYHGIFGSVGIAAGPFLAAVVLATDVTWRQYFLVLAVPGILLAVLLSLTLRHEDGLTSASDPATPSVEGEDDAHWSRYFILLASAMMAGFVYKAVLTFMPRYLDEAGLGLGDLPDRSVRNILTGAVLLLGVIGQYAGGRIARPKTLEAVMAGAFFATVPCLLWMGFAQGVWRVVVMAVFAPMFFMHQPVINSLVAKYVPRRRRSLAYGLSFMLGFGVGSTGSAVAGGIESDSITYVMLAGLALLVGLVSMYLWWLSRARPSGE